MIWQCLVGDDASSGGEVWGAEKISGGPLDDFLGGYREIKKFMHWWEVSNVLSSKGERIRNW